MKRILTINGRQVLKRFLRIWWCEKPLPYSTISDRVVVLSFVAGVLFAILLFSIYS